MNSKYKLSYFNKWNKLKKNISMRSNFPHVKPREVWWCSLGQNIGSEQSFKNDFFSRPVLVLKVFSAETFLGVPLTSKIHEDSENHFNIDDIVKLKGSVILTQSRTLDVRRVSRLIIKIDSDKFKEIKESFIKKLL